VRRGAQQPLGPAPGADPGPDPGPPHRAGAGRADGRAATRLDLRQLSFGGTAAVVTSMGLIVGLGASGAPRATVLGSLLIIALADNLTDALGVHVYQEAERLPQAEALRTTAANFVTRLLTTLSFVAIVEAAPAMAIPLSLAWGVALLAALSWLIARRRGVSPAGEVVRHLAVAAVVMLASRLIGLWISAPAAR
jgi:vacuolar iron transporter family protein